ncbi:VanW family protein [Actinoplanes sp. NPDC023714]|uniref:VanW family protein n=1 Tax=Actinoplanes sp. NPDC023714 TaxID=3154322 RepID=UPI0033F5FCC4
MTGTTYAVAPRRPVIVTTVAVVLTAVVAVAAACATERRPRLTPAGRTIAGVPAGGLEESEVRAAVESSVRARIGQPVTVRIGGTGETFRLDPAAAGITLDAEATVRAAFAATDSTIPAAVRIDPAKLGAALAAHDRAARPATVKLAAPKPRLEAKGDASFTASSRGVDRSEGTAGWTLDSAAAAPVLRTAIGGGRTEATIPRTPAPPGTEPAGLSGVDQLIGTFTTRHACCEPRVTNIHLIAAMVDGTVIAPGTTFSLNAKVGERTRERGFVAAPAIVAGELEDQLGGGVSQFSTTLFNAAWFAGLPVLEHQPHSKYISRYPPGREATLDWGHIDQVIRNDTEAPVVIRVATTGTSVTVALYGHTGDRKVVSTTGPRRPGRNGGFGVSVTRTVHDDGRETGRTTLHWTYTGLD